MPNSASYCDVHQFQGFGYNRSNRQRLGVVPKPSLLLGLGTTSVAHHRRLLWSRGRPTQAAKPFVEKLERGYADIRSWYSGRWVVHPRTGCWDWIGWLSKDGYAKAGLFMGRDGGSAHRFMFQLAYPWAKIDGLDIDHLCYRRGCCNPAHLEAVTHAENCLRARQHKRQYELECEGKCFE